MEMTKKFMKDMENLTKDMVEIILKKKGYDGLYNSDVGGEPCGCEIGDLKPCGTDYPSNCIGGYKHKDGLMYADVPDSGVKGNLARRK